MLDEIAEELNKTALFSLSKHDILNMCIDRAYVKMFPNKPISAKKRKKYIRIEF